MLGEPAARLLDVGDLLAKYANERVERSPALAQEFGGVTVDEAPGEHAAVDDQRHVVHPSRRRDLHALERDVERDGLDGRADDGDPTLVALAVGPASQRRHQAGAVLVRGAGLGQDEDVGAEIAEHGALRGTRGAGWTASLKVPGRDPHSA